MSEQPEKTTDESRSELLDNVLGFGLLIGMLSGLQSGALALPKLAPDFGPVQAG